MINQNQEQYQNNYQAQHHNQLSDNLCEIDENTTEWSSNGVVFTYVNSGKEIISLKGNGRGIWSLALHHYQMIC